MPEPCLNYVLCVFLVLASSSNHPLRRIRTSTIEQVFLNLKGNRPLFRAFAEDGGAFWRALARIGGRCGSEARIIPNYPSSLPGERVRFTPRNTPMRATSTSSCSCC